MDISLLQLCRYFETGIVSSVIERVSDLHSGARLGGTGLALSMGARLKRRKRFRVFGKEQSFSPQAKGHQILEAGEATSAARAVKGDELISALALTREAASFEGFRGGAPLNFVITG